MREYVNSHFETWPLFFLAIWVIEVFQEIDLGIPKDVSVMEFDGVHVFYAIPRLTMMLVPNYEMVKKGAVILLERIHTSYLSAVIQKRLSPV